jgi:integrase/recombinase XerD
MKRSTPGLLISKSIEGFLIFKIAEGLSQRTIDSYEFALRKWVEQKGDRDVSQVKPFTVSSLSLPFVFQR